MILGLLIIEHRDASNNPRQHEQIGWCHDHGASEKMGLVDVNLLRTSIGKSFQDVSTVGNAAVKEVLRFRMSYVARILKATSDLHFEIGSFQDHGPSYERISTFDCAHLCAAPKCHHSLLRDDPDSNDTLPGLTPALSEEDRQASNCPRIA